VKVLALIYSDESRWESASETQREEMYDRYRAFAAVAAAKIVDGAELAPTSAATTVRVRDGQTLVTDGPFAETKEVIGGWAILETKTRAEAVELSMEFMELHRKHWPEFEGESEVRPMFDPGMGP
jgi:hypothetical protein